MANQERQNKGREVMVRREIVSVIGALVIAMAEVQVAYPPNPVPVGELQGTVISSVASPGMVLPAPVETLKVAIRAIGRDLT
jgi:hypothetical protein